MNVIQRAGGLHGRFHLLLPASQDYEALRAKATAAAATPLRCAWVSVATGLKCRMAGPFSRCMCDHSFREHDVLQLPASDPPQQQEQQEEEANIQVKCKVPGCRCAHYTFIPVQGSADLRCRCKHSYRDHNPTTRQCLKCAASASKGCSPKGPPSMAAQVGGKRKGAPLSSKSSSASGCPEGFSPPIRCACNAAYGLHETRFWFDRQPMLSRGSAGGAVAAVKAPNIIPMGGMTSEQTSLLRLYACSLLPHACRSRYI